RRNNMICKLEMNLREGIISVEGSEEFVKGIYEDFRELIKENKYENSNVTSSAKTVTEKKTDPKDTSNNRKKPNQRRSSSQKKPQLLTNLNLRPNNAISLKDFTQQYGIRSNSEIIVLIAYYLKETLNINEITVDHIFTGFNEIGARIPKAFK